MQAAVFSVGIILIAALLLANENKTSNRLLATAVACSLSRYTPYPSPAFIAIPLYYLYVESLTKPEFRLHARQLWHLCPALLGVLIARSEATWIFAKVMLAMPYLILVERRVKEFEARTQAHASTTTQLEARWLQILVAAIFLVFTFDAIDGVLKSRVLLFALSGLVLFALRYSRIFTAELEKERAEDEADDAKTRVLPEEIAKLESKLLSLMQSESLFLNPDLRLSDLAAALSVKPYRVSEVLTRGLRTSFYELVNGYRIEKARELLADPASQHLSILGIALDSGFKSKSVFNDVFKRRTGMTPSQFRDKTSEVRDPVVRMVRDGR
jgi:AraC-like DNA-binding protein